MKHFDKDYFVEVVNSSTTMAEAARKLQIQYSTFIRHAKKFGCYNPNQGGKGTIKGHCADRILTADILTGKYPNYQTYKLKCRLIDEGYIEDRCQLCGWDKKAPGRKYTACELHHKDGNPHNHLFSNLEHICPNCHSLTETYRARVRAPEPGGSE